MRRTKAAQIYRKTGNLRAVQLLLGHTKLESTVRYLGIEVDDALNLAEQVELWSSATGVMPVVAYAQQAIVGRGGRSMAAIFETAARNEPRHWRHQLTLRNPKYSVDFQRE
jgi:hypothetical protein